MGCSACGQRKSGGRIIPVKPNRVKVNNTSRGAGVASNAVRAKLRYTGR